MGLFETAVVFVIAWWLVFFAVLPIGVRSQYEIGDPTPGTEEGAPSDPMLAKKAIWATIGAIAATVCVVIAMRLLLASP